MREPQISHTNHVGTHDVINLTFFLLMHHLDRIS